MSSFEPIITNLSARIEGGDRSRPQQLFGSDSPSAFGFLAPHFLEAKKTLFVILPNDDAVRDFHESALFCSPSFRDNIFVLAGFEVSPYSGLSPNRRVLGQRARFLAAAQMEMPGLYLASATSLTAPTLSKDRLSGAYFEIKKGTVLDADSFGRFLELGYFESPQVEDVGSFSQRQGIVDIFSPFYSMPLRIELFGDEVESIRFFDVETQRSLSGMARALIIPCSEVLLDSAGKERISIYLESRVGKIQDPTALQIALRQVASGQHFLGLEFLACVAEPSPVSAIEYFSESPWVINPIECARATDQHARELLEEAKLGRGVAPETARLLLAWDQIRSAAPFAIEFSRVQIDDLQTNSALQTGSYRALDIPRSKASGRLLKEQLERLVELRKTGVHVFVSAKSMGPLQRIAAQARTQGLRPLVMTELDEGWSEMRAQQLRDALLIHLIPRGLPASVDFKDENFLIIRDEEITGKRVGRTRTSEAQFAEQKVRALRFGDLKPGDLMIHEHHGIGIYEGLQQMLVEGVSSEFIQISYKDGDKLFLPIYKIGQLQKFSGPSSHLTLDKLGGSTWGKTTAKVRSAIREVALDLLKIYASRASKSRPAFSAPDELYTQMENEFPYEETEDQARAIDAILTDLQSPKPMDRLVCGDVGFGKTEVAMRAAFKVIEDGQQVAVVVPTTTLCIQHVENFRRRFKSFNLNVVGLSRFSSHKEIQEALRGIREGRVQIAIGTHRLFSSDVQFKNLGLLILDEEHRFGVLHKERLRKLRASIDTLAMSATPIPRTLNMGLVGIRDLSLINTPPHDRLPVRTYVTRFEPGLVKTAIESEIQRGGQVFFVHNRVQSIERIHHELKALVPKARIQVGHGQMKEEDLERVMVSFFRREFDVLLCTTIIESGIDIPTANTILIDRADTFGLSQLYQLRGRVGRSHERAYCYLMIPESGKIDKEAQERLRVMQENSALGSGLKIAHYDLELRGAGDILGEDQSGHIASVGYDLYFDLLQEAIADARGEVHLKDIDPEISMGIPAFIPETYIGDIRIRLSYYKTLSDISQSEDLDRIEEELRDRFGPMPEAALNLFGLMLIRRICKDTGILELRATKQAIFLTFCEPMRLSAERILTLAQLHPKHYKLFPNNRLRISLTGEGWPAIHQALSAFQNSLQQN